MVVMKFGGTSVQDASALRKVASIILDHALMGRGLVCVLSATAGTTNQLLALAADSCHQRTNIAERCALLEERHQQIIDELIDDADHRLAASERLKADVAQLQRLCLGIQILQECTPMTLDAVAVFGERMITGIVTQALRTLGLDVVEIHAPQIVKTDSNFTHAAANMTETQRACHAIVQPELDAGKVVLTQGFAGSDELGNITTLGRGGSDASAAIIGAAIGADEIEIWTDVSGVYSADPRQIPEAQPIGSLAFGEVRELALYGAKVLHPDTILPAVQMDIPVVIKNTFRPQDAGTRITRERTAHARVHAVSLMRPCRFVSGGRSEVLSLATSVVHQARVLLHGASLEHAMAVIHTPDDEAETDVAVAITGTALEAVAAAIIVLIGPMDNGTDILAAIHSVLGDLEPLAVVQGVSPWSAFVAVPLEQGVDALRRLHQLTA